MAINRTPVLKRCRALGIEPAYLGIDKKSTRELKRSTRKVSEYGQQLREKQEREAAAKEFEQKKRIELGLPEETATEEEFPGGEPGRPYARGRAYSADHYGNSQE